MESEVTCQLTEKRLIFGFNTENLISTLSARDCTSFSRKKKNVHDSAKELPSQLTSAYPTDELVTKRKKPFHPFV